MAEVGAYALCSPDDVYSVLKLESPHGQEQIVRLINQITAECESFCNRKFIERTYTDEQYDGDGTATLLLMNFPVSEVSKLISYEDGPEHPATDFKFRTGEEGYGEVILKYSIFPSSVLGITVTYKAGYTLALLPEDLRLSIAEAVAFRYRVQDQKLQGVTHKSSETQTMDITEETFPKTVLEVWNRYRKIPV